MERKEFLEKCESLGFWLEKIIDLGSLVHGHDPDQTCFREFAEEFYNPNHETLSFLNIGHLEDFEVEDQDDQELFYNEALHLNICQKKKFGFIARLNVPERDYKSYGFHECVGILSCPEIYAETMEEIYDIAVKDVLKIRIDQGYTPKG